MREMAQARSSFPKDQRLFPRAELKGGPEELKGASKGVKEAEGVALRKAQEGLRDA